ncbi:MAG: patatin-like phospholipase family protein [Actinobacteria bacterium]|nr:patatin-like phospholipase family protein [Actinomycetota bacterium]
MARRRTRRGIVLGGGGVLGAAWMTGALCALEQVHGFDPREADVIVGTSAGSVVGALLAAGITPLQMRDHQLGKSISEGPLAGFSWDYERATGGQRPKMPKLRGPGSGELLRNSLGRLRHMPTTAFLSALMPEGNGSLERVGHLMDAITPMGEWSSHPNFWAVAMDYQTGDRVAFGQATAPVAPLSEAVMASCAIPGWFSPVSINGRRYVDGGAVSATNVDLVAAAALDEVFVLAPMVSFALDEPDSVLARLERRWRIQVTKRCLSEVEKVRDAGADVVVLGPGPADLEMMGGNAMDLSRRVAVLKSSMRTSAKALADPEQMPGYADAG